MRELKFRIWDKREQKFEASRDMALSKNGDLYYIRSAGNELLEVDNEYYIIQQYTGLKDKNNKEIYEGDILRYINLIIGQVIFAFGSYQVKTLENLNFGLDDICYHCTIEIIGNIYENPELLENNNEI